MKRFAAITACILLICAAMFYFMCLPRDTSDVTAENGVLNLAGADFTDALFTLDGEWEFYYGKLYAPEDFTAGKPEGDMISAPSSWVSAGYPREGRATYRLTVQTGEPELSIFLPEIVDSSVVYVNGLKVFEAGVVGETAQTSVSGMRNAFLSVHPQNGRAEIIVQAAASNPKRLAAGLFYRVEVGRPDLLHRDALTRRALLAFTLGIFGAMCLYHAVLFLYRRESAYLAFSLACLIGVARMAIQPNGLASLLLPGGIGEGLYAVMLALFAFHTASIMFFAHAAFAIPIESRFRRVVYAAGFAASVLGSVPKVPVMTMYLVLIPMIWTVISVARSKRLRESPYYGLFFFALVVFIFWHPFNVFVLGDSMFLPGAVSNLFLVLSQCVMLAVSYAETKRRETELSAKIDFYHQMAHDLLTPLTIISTDVQVAAVRPEKAPEKLKDSQAEIMKMAGMINAALKGGDGK